jgi:hypothetical protein
MAGYRPAALPLSYEPGAQGREGNGRRGRSARRAATRHHVKNRDRGTSLQPEKLRLQDLDGDGVAPTGGGSVWCIGATRLTIVAFGLGVSAQLPGIWIVNALKCTRKHADPRAVRRALLEALRFLDDEA